MDERPQGLREASLSSFLRDEHVIWGEAPEGRPPRSKCIEARSEATLDDDRGRIDIMVSRDEQGSISNDGGLGRLPYLQKSCPSTPDATRGLSSDIHVNQTLSDLLMGTCFHSGYFTDSQLDP